MTKNANANQCNKMLRGSGPENFQHRNQYQSNNTEETDNVI